jgi:hypothetical protein
VSQELAAGSAGCGASVINISFSQQTCEEFIGSCNSTDNTRVNQFLDCMQAIPACTPSQVDPSGPANWLDAWSNCHAKLSGTDATCSVAVNF